ncbi:hypothetical protein P4I53_01175, partial [Escherichia coli]|uniref:hypothetical protein n=1 Tax=Escherichia coli TaxID=562 RepID=UPI003CEB6F3F
RAYCLKTQPATGETYPKSDLFNKAAFSINVIQTLRFAFIFRLSRRQHFAKVTPLLHRHGD